MSRTLQITTTILPGSRIEIVSPDLPVGKSATVSITVEDEGKRPFREVLGDYPGHQLFQSAAEVDAFLNEERDAWDK